MDTELFYKYKDGLHPDIKSGQLTMDKSVYRKYTDSYNTNADDDINNLNRRLWNCHLRAEDNDQCRKFLTDILIYNKNNMDIEEFIKLYDWLMKQELVEIIFTCY